jgi:hypothetical protein
MERDEEGSDVAEEVIRARRIELYDDQDNLTGILSGGGVEEEESSVAVLMLHSPDGEAAASIAMHRDSGNPSIHLYTAGGGDIIIYFNDEGRAVVRMVNEDGTAGEFIPE